MMIVREVGTEDLDALWDLIGQANLGMTSLKIDKEQLADRIERSHFAFRRTNRKRLRDDRSDMRRGPWMQTRCHGLGHVRMTTGLRTSEVWYKKSHR